MAQVATLHELEYCRYHSEQMLPQAAVLHMWPHQLGRIAPAPPAERLPRQRTATARSGRKQHVQVRSTSTMAPDLLTGRCLDVRVGMCTGVCADLCIDMAIDMCVNMCVDMAIDMCVHMCVDMRIDVCIDV